MAGEVKTTLERELKLSVPSEFALNGFSGEAVRKRTFVSTYYDTPDLRLVRAGVTLRRRVENGKGLWQLKLPSGVARLELEVPGGPTAVPEPLSGLLLGVRQRRELAPVARLRTSREVVLVGDADEPVAEVALDSVAVLDGRKVAWSFGELEIELVAGDEGDLRHLERELRKAGAEDGDGRPKVLRALGVVPDTPGSLAVEPVARIEQVLAAQYRALVARDPRVRFGDDPEDVHQMRVATRRLRAVLRAAGSWLDPEWSEALRAELRWLGRLLGPVRDLDVLVSYLRDEAGSLDEADRKAFGRALAALENERATVRTVLLDGLRTERYLDLLDALERAAAEPRLGDGGGSLSAIAAAEFRKLRKAVRGLDGDPSDAELHAVRIRGKRARYATELAQPEVGAPATKFLRRARRFQDLVGDHQDAVVAEERLRELAGKAGARGAFGAGVLAERQRERRAKARASFRAEWRKLESAGLEAWK